MSPLRVVFRGTLGLLIVVGLWSSLRLSYLTVTATAPCPSILWVPLCYLAAIGYLCMFAAQMPPLGKLKSRLFYPAWALVFFIAASGSGVEIFVGDTCPRTAGGVPMCYISLGFCAAILLLYQLELWSQKLTSRI
jgi:hypothetical protein